ncbi:hypothetical protein [Zhihengliuella sp.]|uniref:hypothetical protein n=1 Tax=Zhihengliuella sp. TaxID=1954483 RepID=UPI002811CDFF|nr:hypothetical protein [Zhihengliuella sp.]
MTYRAVVSTTRTTTNHDPAATPEAGYKFRKKQLRDRRRPFTSRDETLELWYEEHGDQVHVRYEEKS